MLNQTELWSMKDRFNAVLRELSAGHVAEVVRDPRAGVHSFILALSSYSRWPSVMSATRTLELAAGRPVTVGRTHGQPVIRVADEVQPVTLEELLAQPPANVREMAVPLGVSPSSGPLWLEIGSNRSNILICGQPGSGKTWLTHSIVTGLTHRVTPKRLKFVLLDPKRHNLSPLSSAISPFVERLEQGHDAIGAALSAYAGIVSGARSYERETIIVVDEFLEVLDQCDGAERALTTIMRSGREYGYRLIACSQAGNIGALAGALSGLWSLRIVGRMDNAKSAYDAAGVSDSGAEKLTGAGDFLAVYDGKATRFRAPVPPVTYSSEPVRIEPEQVLERVLAVAEAPVMPVSMAIPVDDSRDTAKDATVYRQLTEQAGQPPSLNAWAEARFNADGKWSRALAGPRVAWMKARYEALQTTATGTATGTQPSATGSNAGSIENA